MKITATGWRRNMGPNNLGSIDIATAQVEPADSRWPRSVPSIRAEGDGLTIGWSKSLRLSGDYEIVMEFSKQEVARLFRLIFGDELTEELLKEAGLSIASMRPSGPELHGAIRDMTIGEFMSAVFAQQPGGKSHGNQEFGLRSKVTDFDFSRRTVDSLSNNGINFVGDLVQKTEAELLKLPNFGRKSLNEVKTTLQKLGLHLGMKVVGWRREN